MDLTTILSPIAPLVPADAFPDVPVLGLLGYKMSTRLPVYLAQTGFYRCGSHLLLHCWQILSGGGYDAASGTVSTVHPVQYGLVADVDRTSLVCLSVSDSCSTLSQP